MMVPQCCHVELNKDKNGEFGTKSHHKLKLLVNWFSQFFLLLKENKPVL